MLVPATAIYAALLGIIVKVRQLNDLSSIAGPAAQQASDLGRMASRTGGTSDASPPLPIGMWRNRR